MSSQIEHTDVGAYALGLLEAGDRRAFEAHLHGCGRCQAELGELSGTAGALFELAPGAAEPGPEAGAEAGAEAAAEGDEPSAPPAPVLDMVRRKRRADRRFRRTAYVVGTAAAAVALGAGVAVGAALGGESGEEQKPPVAQSVTGQQFRAVNASTGASGTVGLVDKGWGTQVSLELRGIKGPLRCHLEAVSRGGERSVVAGWRVPDKGYGVPGQPKPLIMQGGTGLDRQEIDHFTVRLDDGGTLLTIPL